MCAAGSHSQLTSNHPARAVPPRSLLNDAVVHLLCAPVARFAPAALPTAEPRRTLTQISASAFPACADFPEEPPARATFAVKDLPLGARVEIDAIALVK